MRTSNINNVSIPQPAAATTKTTPTTITTIIMITTRTNAMQRQNLKLFFGIYQTKPKMQLPKMKILPISGDNTKTTKKQKMKLEFH